VPIQKLAKYAKRFDLLIVHEAEFPLPFLDIAQEAFSKVFFRTLTQTAQAPLNCHLLIVCASAEAIKQSSLSTELSSIQRLESIILSPDFTDASVLKAALSIRAMSVRNLPQDEDTFVSVMLNIIPHLIQKHNESMFTEYHRYIAEYSDYLFCIRKDEKSIYANNGFKKHFGTSILSELDSCIDESDIGKMIKIPGSNQKVISRNDASTDVLNEYFINTHPLKDGELLISMFPLNIPLKNSEKRLLNRMSFIELLKNAFVIHNGEDEPIPVIMIHIENSEKIIEQHGENIYNELCKKMVFFATNYFGAEAEIAQWRKDVYTVISAGVELDDLKAILDQFHKDVFTHLSIENAMPALDSFVIDMQGVDLNRAIRIIDHIRHKQLLASDIGNLVYHEISAINQELDDKQQVFSYLEKLMFNKSPVKLLNFYKGIRISTPARLVKLADGLVYIAIEKIQGYAMKLEESTVIQATNIPYDIQANIKIVDVSKKITVLSDFKPLKASANNRQYIRIQSDHRMHVTMASSKRVTAGTIMDISIKSIACKVGIANIPPAVGTSVMLQFNLPLESMENGMVNMAVKGKVDYVKKGDEFTKVVIDLDLKEPFESHLIEYIYNRQQALITEIKTIANKL
jgi:GGDEF domain-containing protein